MQNDFIDGSLGMREVEAIVPAMPIFQKIKEINDEIMVFLTKNYGLNVQHFYDIIVTY
jgi:hypothetical protein